MAMSFFCVSLSGAELVFLIAIVDTAMFNTTDKVTSPACELPLCVQLGPTLIASAPAAATVT